LEAVSVVVYLEVAASADLLAEVQVVAEQVEAGKLIC